MQYLEFLSHIREKPIHHSYLLIGSDPYLQDEARNALVAAVQKRMDSQTILETVDLDSTSIDELVTSARSLQLFATHQILWVKGIMKTREAGVKSIAEYLADPSSFTVLLFSAGDLDKADRRKKVFQALQSCVELVELSPFKERQLRDWIVSRFSELGFSIEEDAIRLLVTTYGSELGRMNNEIEKLRLFAGSETRITIAMVEAIAGLSREHSVFEFLDAIAAKDRLTALRLAGEMMQGGEAFLGVMSLLARQLRSFLQIQELDGEANPAQIGKRIGVYNAYVVKRMIGQAKRFPRIALSVAIHRLGMLDDRIKRSAADWKTFTELLILDLIGREHNL